MYESLHALNFRLLGLHIFKNQFEYEVCTIPYLIYKYFQFNKYFGELNSETGLVTSENRETRDGGIDEASDCENYEEIVTEFVVPSEEVESLEADEGGHEVPEGDRESIERGLQPLERESKALEESQEHVDTVEDAIDTEGSARKRCHPCVHCTEIFMHRLRFSSTIVVCGNIYYCRGFQGNTSETQSIPTHSGPAFCDTSSRSTELSQHQAAKRTTLQPQITTSVQCVRKPSGSALT